MAIRPTLQYILVGQLHLKRIQTNETRYGQNWIHTTWACPKRVACCRTWEQFQNVDGKIMTGHGINNVFCFSRCAGLINQILWDCCFTSNNVGEIEDKNWGFSRQTAGNTVHNAHTYIHTHIHTHTHTRIQSQTNNWLKIAESNNAKTETCDMRCFIYYGWCWCDMKH